MKHKQVLEHITIWLYVGENGDIHFAEATDPISRIVMLSPYAGETLEEIAIRAKELVNCPNRQGTDS